MLALFLLVQHEGDGGGMEPMGGFDKLLQRVQALLRPGSGDQWLSQRSWRDIVQYSHEEVLELLDAVRQGESEAIMDELSDLCFHLAIYSAFSSRDFGVDINAIAERALVKLDRRLQADVEGSQAAYDYWQQQKQCEKRASHGSVCAGVPRDFPALLQAAKLREWVARIGFVPLDSASTRGHFRKAVRALVDDSSGQPLSSSAVSALIFLLVEWSLAEGIDPEAALLNHNSAYRASAIELEQAWMLSLSEGVSLTPDSARDFYLSSGDAKLD